MWTRILEKWQYKLAALAIAIALRSYVTGLNDPHSIKQFNVSLALSRIPTGLVVTDAPQFITVQASGSASTLDSLSASSFTATADLRNAKVGFNAQVPIDVELEPTITSDINIESHSPRTAAVTLDNKKRVQLQIIGTFRHLAPPGLHYSNPTIMPAMATVEGAESVIDHLTKVVIYADDVVSGNDSSPGVLDGIGTIEAIDDHQNEMSGLTILPQQAEIRIQVNEQNSTKELIINPSIAGDPTYPMSIQSVDVHPDRISVEGDPATLSRISVVSTEAIDVSHASGDIQKRVKVILPSGVTALHTNDAVVTVHIIGSGSKARTGQGGASLTGLRS